MVFVLVLIFEGVLWAFLDLFKCDISEIKKVDVIDERVTVILRLIRKWAWAWTLILKNVREKFKKGHHDYEKCKKVAWLVKVKLVTDLDLKNRDLEFDFFLIEVPWAWSFVKSEPSKIAFWLRKSVAPLKAKLDVDFENRCGLKKFVMKV